MTRKRGKPYFSNHSESSFLTKKPRHSPSPSPSITPISLDEEDPKDKPTRQSASAMVVVTGLSNGCSVLKLKSRFEMYGCVSRLRVDHGIGYITFRSKDSAEAAIADASDPLGITVDNRKVQVSWEDDTLPQWRKGIGFSSKERPSSKLLLPEVPLSKRGRGNKLGSGSGSASPKKNGLDLPFKGRDIIAYDDLF